MAEFRKLRGRNARPVWDSDHKRTRSSGGLRDSIYDHSSLASSGAGHLHQRFSAHGGYSIRMHSVGGN